MRTIKFRAWDKKSKKMRMIDTMAFHGNGAFDEPTGELKLVNMWGRDCIEDKPIILHREIGEFEIMQYTGLKDRNGVEIYEGDLIGESFSPVGEVKWFQDHCQFLVDFGDGIEPQELGEWCVKIGSIYENPELLTKEE